MFTRFGLPACSVTVVSLLMGIALCTLFESTMPIWALFLSVGLVCLFLIPAGLVMAVSVRCSQTECDHFNPDL